jgi:hypothetical protein
MVYPGGVLMAEAVSAPYVAITDKTKVSSIDRSKNTVRLVFLSGVDKDQLIEYSLTGADVDPRIQNGDMPIMATCQGRQLLKLAFMPGTEPAEPAAQPHHPIVPPKPPVPAESQEEVKLVTPATNQAIPKPEGQPFNQKGVLKKKQLDPNKDFFGFSLEKIKEGKPTGNVLFHDLHKMYHATTLIESLKTLEEGSQVEYITINYQPVKIGAQGTLFGGKGGGRGYYDPEAEKRRQESIEKQNAKIITKDLLIELMKQYPVQENPDNLERIFILLPQMVDAVKREHQRLLEG